MYLFLDPRAQSEIIVGITSGFGTPRFFSYQRDDKVSLLEFILKKVPTALHGVVIIPGPGGFSNVRSAVTLANTLGFAAKLPVISVRPKKTEESHAVFERGILMLKNGKSDKNIRPLYLKPPNITFARRNS